MAFHTWWLFVVTVVFIAAALTKPALKTLFNRITGCVFAAFGLPMLGSRT